MQRIPVWSTSIQGLGALVSDSGYLLRVSWPAFLGTILAIAATHTYGAQSLEALGLQLMAMVLYLPLLIRVYEYTVDGTKRPIHHALAANPAQLGLVIVYSWAQIAAAIPGVILMMIAARMIHSSFIQLGVLIAGLVLMLFLPLMIFFIFPAVSTGRKTSLSQANKELLGNRTRLFFSMIIATILAMILMIIIGLGIRFGFDIAGIGLKAQDISGLFSIPIFIAYTAVVGIAYREQIVELNRLREKFPEANL